jgi:hypothetical protein
MGGPLVPQDHPRLVAWSSGMILASGTRGSGFNSRGSPLQPSGENAFRQCTKSCAETRDRISRLTLSQLSYRGCCEGQDALTALGQAKRPMLCLSAVNGWPSSRAWKN